MFSPGNRPAPDARRRAGSEPLDDASRAALPLLEALISQDTIFALDDLEGVEKGVANLSLLYRLSKLKSHFLIYPAPGGLLSSHDLTSYSLFAVFLPVSVFQFAKQG